MFPKWWSLIPISISTWQPAGSRVRARLYFRQWCDGQNALQCLHIHKINKIISMRFMRMTVCVKKSTCFLCHNSARCMSRSACLHPQQPRIKQYIFVLSGALPSLIINNSSSVSSGTKYTWAMSNANMHIARFLSSSSSSYSFRSALAHPIPESWFFVFKQNKMY